MPLYRAQLLQIRYILLQAYFCSFFIEAYFCAAFCKNKVREACSRRESITFEGMNAVDLKKLALFVGLLMMSALLMQFVWQVSEPDRGGAALSAEKVNLALRRTADALLKEMGDSTSQIPPVEQIDAHIWLIRLEHTFDYDKLPSILQASLDLHGIVRNYDVAVLRCADGVLQLGYNFEDFAQNNSATCQGRDLPTDCYNLQVTFASGGKNSGLPLAGWFFSGLLAVALFALGLKWRRPPQQEAAEAAPEGLRFGQSRLDVANQLLTCGKVNHQITYREAKLLHLFVQRPNQVLERSFILDNVWADEGIMVGRSVDMFVSRLRKMLRDDPSVQLVAVHGVGYRMEVP